MDNRWQLYPPSKSDMEKLMRHSTRFRKKIHFDCWQNAPVKTNHYLRQGQLHLDIIKYRIEKLNGLVMEFEKTKDSLSWNHHQKADEMYRHKKQSGGAGQFIEVHMRIEPYYEGMEILEGLGRSR